LPSNPRDLAKVIYSVLRDIDSIAYDKIYFRSLPLDSRWDAIRDRIQRAATGSGQT
jgi:L-threonylcarbamoyladenylate synthase